MLIVLAGLPGVGKSTFAAALAARVDAVVLAVDLVEDALLAAGLPAGSTTGVAAYGVVERVAEAQLAVGRSVVVDAVNDDPRAREQWIGLAERSGAETHWFELRLADPDRHRARLEGRGQRFTRLPEPGWDTLAPRADALDGWAAERWAAERTVLDAAEPVEALVAAALGAVRPPRP
ncbi:MULTISPECIES: AAA family ATPase [unclassified Curtobacterium]|uniref:AAA family ATPase n=1 Tax=unclassified Curtobacterium TaxID=257496 RepID=UPI000DA97D09|nr:MULTISPECIES: AAA family ATPase [unclassified Curtobacterium]PZE78297.1 ATP-binding protein [Curtobacterium sp. MCBD17_019]WIE55131.1 AAA family ATPase [Curtobacterium sp. MCBD17_003]